MNISGSLYCTCTSVLGLVMPSCEVYTHFPVCKSEPPRNKYYFYTRIFMAPFSVFIGSEILCSTKLSFHFQQHPPIWKTQWVGKKSSVSYNKWISANDRSWDKKKKFTKPVMTLFPRLSFISSRCPLVDFCCMIYCRKTLPRNGLLIKLFKDSWTINPNLYMHAARCFTFFML